jgi:hypothetical protein
MVGEVRLYVEGGGDQRDVKRQLERGMGQFLARVRNLARSKRIRWCIVACGGRGATFADYLTALASHPDAFNVLLVDAEGPVTAASPWDHLKATDGWDKPAGVEDRHCHLMAQAMEAWFLADREALRQFYGNRFNDSALPNNPNVEQVSKGTLATALANATRQTQKGLYHKTRHGFKLLEVIRLDEVRRHAPFCDRLVTTLAAEMGGTL